MSINSTIQYMQKSLFIYGTTVSEQTYTDRESEYAKLHHPVYELGGLFF